MLPFSLYGDSKLENNTPIGRVKLWGLPLPHVRAVPL